MYVRLAVVFFFYFGAPAGLESRAIYRVPVERVHIIQSQKYTETLFFYNSCVIEKLSAHLLITIETWAITINIITINGNEI